MPSGINFGSTTAACAVTSWRKVREGQGEHIMIKLYRTRFTPKQLRVLSRYCDGFCPEGHSPMICKRTGSDFVGNLPRFTTLECLRCEPRQRTGSRPFQKVKICTLLNFSHLVTNSQNPNFPIDECRIIWYNIIANR